jgi:hypothetical protein
MPGSSRIAAELAAAEGRVFVETCGYVSARSSFTDGRTDWCNRGPDVTLRRIHLQVTVQLSRVNPARMHGDDVILSGQPMSAPDVIIS